MNSASDGTPSPAPSTRSWRRSATVSPRLASWNDGEAKTAILEFVADVTREGDPAFVPPSERIAVFDNDGTLWAEQPLYFQFLFALDRIKALATDHPEWRDTEPFASVLEGNHAAVLASGEKALVQIIAATHAGITTAEFSSIVAQWLETAQHHRFQRRYTELVYVPMLELLAHLRDNGFKVFIVSGGGVEFMRVFAERVYGVPPEQVIGSSAKTRFELDANGKPQLIKDSEVEFVDDGVGKPSGINRFIGRPPIFAFGNSDADIPMLQWTTGAGGPRFGALLHHDDVEREWAYDRTSHVGRLDQGLGLARQQGWTVVSMRHDWSAVFAERPAH